MSEFYKRNRLEKLPPELKYYIAEFVPHNDNVPYQYIPEFKNVILDWYNKYRSWDTSGEIYRHYDKIYEIGISQDEIPFMKFAFKFYRAESRFYHITMNHAVGQFKKIAKRRTYTFGHLKQNKK